MSQELGQSKEVLKKPRNKTIEEKIQSVNTNANLTRKAAKVRASLNTSARSASTSLLALEKNNLISMKNLPTIRDKLSYLQPNLSQLRKTDYQANEYQTNYVNL